MNQKVLQPDTIEKTARNMRQFVKSAQRKLLEFEVMMSVKEIKDGKSVAFADADALLKAIK